MSIQKLVLKKLFSDGICKLCHAGEENLDHLIYKCDKVEIFSSYVLFIIRNYVVPDNMMDFQKVACMPTDEKEKEILNMLLTICRWSIWKRRNINRHDNKELINAESLSLLKCEIQKHMQVLSLGIHQREALKNVQIHQEVNMWMLQI